MPLKFIEELDMKEVGSVGRRHAYINRGNGWLVQEMWLYQKALHEDDMSPVEFYHWSKPHTDFSYWKHNSIAISHRHSDFCS